jgi:hypothetical protein
MTTPTYTPRAGSLASQVIGFFRHKPDEELLLDDITDKFDATRGNIHTLLADAVKADLLARYRNADGDYVYKPGTACGVYAVPDVTIAATVAKAADAQMAAIDFDALQVDDGVAYQPAAGVKGFSKWDPLFARLTKAGQSVELPRPCTAACLPKATNATRKPATQRPGPSAAPAPTPAACGGCCEPHPHLHRSGRPQDAPPGRDHRARLRRPRPAHPQPGARPGQRRRSGPTRPAPRRDRTPSPTPAASASACTTATGA